MADLEVSLPDRIASVAELDDLLSEPTPRLVRAMASVEGDILVLGAGGKMGPSLARLAVRAGRAAGQRRRVIGVSRFSRAPLRKQLEQWGVETMACDLLEPGVLATLPSAPNVIFMAGRKFGSAGGEALTWAMNAYLPGLVAQRFAQARLIVFSSGNVYPFTPIASGGSTEADPPGPVGEYAQSVLARERVFEHFSRQQGTPVTIIRLNYAIDLRYGVLLDIGRQVYARHAVDTSMGHVNLIWQGDANAYALMALGLCSSPPQILNITGPELVPVRWLAQRFGEALSRQPEFRGEEATTALLSNAGRCFSLFGYPIVPLGTMVHWVAQWLECGGVILDKPTHFEVRDGRY